MESVVEHALIQVIEYRDILTLVEMFFLNKRIHNKVMEVLKDEFNLIRRISKLFNGAIYFGTSCFTSCCEHEHYIEYEEKYFEKDTDYFYKRKEIIDFLKTECPKHTYRTGSNITDIYLRLYPFNIDLNAYYIKSPKSTILFQLTDEFSRLLPRYRYKMSSELIKIMIGFAINGSNNIEFIKNILNSDFNVDKIIKISHIKTTILHQSIRVQNWSAINHILDKKPNLFIYDQEGVTAAKLFELHIKKEKHQKNPWMADLIDKFNKLKNEQNAQNKNIWL